MAEEGKPAEVEIPTQAELLNEEPEADPVEPPDPLEADARAGGWVSKEEWIAAGKDARGWRAADVWLDRGEFMKTIRTLQNEVVNTKQQVKAAFETGRQIAEASMKKEIDDLKLERREAMEAHDLDKADELSDKIDVLKEKAKAPAPEVRGAPTPPPEYSIFLDRNPWYNIDPALHYAADGIGYEFAKVNPKASAADLYFFVERKMKERFPELTGKQAGRLPPSPDGSNTKGNSSGALPQSYAALKKGMEETERSIMKTLIETKVFKNEEEYLKEYAKASRR